MRIAKEYMPLADIKVSISPKICKKNSFVKLWEKTGNEDFSMIIDNQHITRRKFYAFSHSAKLLYTNFVKEDNRNLRG